MGGEGRMQIIADPNPQKLAEMKFKIQKNPRVCKIIVRNSGAGNGVRRFYGRLEKCVLSAGTTHVHKITRFRGGGRFYFYGRADFLKNVSHKTWSDKLGGILQLWGTLDDASNAPSPQWNTEKTQRFFIWCAIKCRFDVIQLTIWACLLTIGAFLLTALASLLTVGASLLTVGKCI